MSLLSSFPSDILVQIFLKLDLQSICNVRLVSIQFYQNIEQVFKRLCFEQIQPENEKVMLSQMDTHFEELVKDFDWKNEYFPDVKDKIKKSSHFIEHRKYYILFRSMNDMVWDPKFTNENLKITSKKHLKSGEYDNYAPSLAKRRLPQNRTSTWWIQFHSHAKQWICLGIATQTIRLNDSNKCKRHVYNQDHMYSISSRGQLYVHQRNCFERGEVTSKEWNFNREWNPVFVRLDCDLKNGLLMITCFEQSEEAISVVLELDPSFKSQRLYPYAMLASHSLDIEIHSHLKNDVPKWIKDFKPDFKKTNKYEPSKMQ